MRHWKWCIGLAGIENMGWIYSAYKTLQTEPTPLGTSIQPYHELMTSWAVPSSGQPSKTNLKIPVTMIMLMIVAIIVALMVAMFVVMIVAMIIHHLCNLPFSQQQWPTYSVAEFFILLIPWYTRIYEDAPSYRDRKIYIFPPVNVKKIYILAYFLNLWQNLNFWNAEMSK